MLLHDVERMVTTFNKLYRANITMSTALKNYASEQSDVLLDKYFQFQLSERATIAIEEILFFKKRSDSILGYLTRVHKNNFVYNQENAIYHLFLENVTLKHLKAVAELILKEDEKINIET